MADEDEIPKIPNFKFGTSQRTENFDICTPSISPRDLIDDPMVSFRANIIAATRPKVLDFSQPQMGITLTDSFPLGEDAGTAATWGSWFGGLFSSTELASTPGTYACYVRIPIIHGNCLPDPFQASSTADYDGYTMMHTLAILDKDVINAGILSVVRTTPVKVLFTDKNLKYARIVSVDAPIDANMVLPVGARELLANGGARLGDTPEKHTQISPLGLKHGGEKADWEGIEVHYTVTKNAKDAIEVLGTRGLSYHYIIDKDGTRTMLIDPDYVAYHGGNNNTKYIGISLVNFGNGATDASKVGVSTDNWIQVLPGRYGLWEPYTSAQISTMVALVAELQGKYPTIEYINGHEDADARKSDPGPLFDSYWSRFGLKRGPNPASVKNRPPDWPRSPIPRDYYATVGPPAESFSMLDNPPTTDSEAAG